MRIRTERLQKPQPVTKTWKNIFITHKLADLYLFVIHCWRQSMLALRGWTTFFARRRSSRFGSKYHEDSQMFDPLICSNFAIRSNQRRLESKEPDRWYRDLSCIQVKYFWSQMNTTKDGEASVSSLLLNLEEIVCIQRDPWGIGAQMSYGTYFI